MGYLRYEDFNSSQPAEYWDYENSEVEWRSPDRYEIISKIGRGKYSEVFKGIDTVTKSFVVIKVLKPVKKKKIKREIKILSIVSGGPNIVRLLDTVQDPHSKTPALIFEFIENMDFRTLYPKLTDLDVRYYMLSLLHALKFCHSKGIMHRDVKPHNIIINPYERTLRLIDWGLAEFYHKDTPYNVRVASRYFKGPELLVDHRLYHYNLDMWSLGCMFAAIIFRKEPFFRGESNTDQLVKITRVLGTDGLWAYISKYNINLPREFNGLIKPCVERSWESFMTPENRSLCNDEAIAFLNRLLRYDMAERIQACDAIDHPYFDPVRGAV
ncbi:CMGC/CK2 protein kinase [Perkinsela sp. CCAP 1560/4]|nr:CMGC/CK2 protein kinase [Perkinsela sp. CCAP 1560/4]|eukprot:KNH04010.1 CMGC/CK2 protein kinase [Perkinsela sp. CCAP 1560/4]